MFVLIDHALAVRQFHLRAHARQLRFYYQLVDYPRAILRLDELDYEEWQGRVGYLLSNIGGLNAEMVFRDLLGVPASWRGHKLSQVTIRTSAQPGRPAATRPPSARPTTPCRSRLFSWPCCWSRPEK